MSEETMRDLLPRRFFDRSAEIVAPALLGATIVSKVGGTLTRGIIVETEAYLGGEDPASHAYGLRRNARNAALYGPAGTWYVYLSYGIHWCANLVCGVPGRGSAVLLRAVQPVEGVAVMRRRRGPVVDRDLCSGPGRLCQALRITRALNGVDMRAGPVWILAGPRGEAAEIRATPRIGITKASDWPLRFLLRDSPWVSGPRAARSR